MFRELMDGWVGLPVFICPICGAEMHQHCDFNVPRQAAPWLDDYYLMSTGEMTHQQHQVMVARWHLHHPDEISKKVFLWSKKIIQQNNDVF